MGDPAGCEATENSSSSDDGFFTADAAPNDVFIGDLGAPPTDTVMWLNTWLQELLTVTSFP